MKTFCNLTLASFVSIIIYSGISFPEEKEEYKGERPAMLDNKIPDEKTFVKQRIQSPEEKRLEENPQNRVAS